MRHALISPPEGDRLCEVQDAPGNACSPLFWAECPDDVTPETHDYVDGAFVAKPLPEVVPPVVTQASGVEEM